MEKRASDTEDRLRLRPSIDIYNVYGPSKKEIFQEFEVARDMEGRLDSYIHNLWFNCTWPVFGKKIKISCHGQAKP